MTAPLSNKIVYGIILSFIAAFGIGIAFEAYWVLAIPMAMAVLGLAFLSLDKLMLFIVFMTPLSITLTDKQFNVGLSLPTEPLLFGVTCLVIFKWLHESFIDNKILKHPIVWAIGFYLIWMLITTLTSSLPIVSLKFFIAKLWFIIPYFYVMLYVFMKNENNYERFFWLFLIPLLIAAMYTMFVHAQHGFSKETSTWVMWPFFKEHTVYGAVLAMFYPVSTYFFLRKGDLGIRTVAFILFAILTAAVILSYTRAAWVSIVAAFGVFILLRLKIKFSYLMVFAIVGGGMLYSSYDELSRNFLKNKQDSSEKLGEHVQSISNVSTDASNMERINRWKSAYRMFEQRPFFGWGPGTYMFTYAPFQKPHEKTIISTNSGNRGNAHSEYLGPLAESGVLGMLSVVILFSVVVYRGIRVYHETQKERLKWYAMVSLLGLITYFTHGFLNNFLDMDKASAPVWGFIAIIVSLDLRNQHNKA